MKKSITKKDIAEWIKVKNKSIPAVKLEQLMEAFFAEIATALVCGDRVELRGFGSMVVRLRNNKIARNPRTSETVEIPNKGHLYFRPSRELIKKLNKGLVVDD